MAFGKPPNEPWDTSHKELSKARHKADVITTPKPKPERPMTEEEKLLHMCEVVHGKIEGGRCEYEVTYDIDSFHFGPIGVNLVKGDDNCAHYSKIDLLFDYITRDWVTNEE